MAENQIKAEELIEKDVFADVRASATATLPVMREMSTMLQNFLMITKESVKSNPLGSADDIKQLAKAQSEANTIAKAKLDIDKQIIAEEAKLATVMDQATGSISQQHVELAKLRLGNEEAKKQAKELAKEELGLRNEYQKKSKILNDLRNEYKNLAAQNKANTVEAKALLVQVTALDRELKNIDATVGQHQRSVGNYEKALSNLPAPIQNLIGQLKALGLAGLVWKGITTAANFFYEGTERGSELMERRLAGMGAAWNVLKSQIIGSVEGIDNALENSGKKTEHWYTNITAAASAFIQNGGFGVGFNTLFNAQKIVMNAAATAAEDYTAALQELEDLERAMIVPRAERNRDIVKARELIYDETKTLKEKIQIVKQVFYLESIQAEKEVEHQKAVVAQMEIANAEKRKLGLEMDADDMKLQQAKAKVIDLETQSATRTLKLHREIHKLEMEMKKEQMEATKEQTEQRNRAYEDEKKNAERIRTEEQKTSSEVMKGYEDYYQQKSQIYRYTAIGDKHFSETLAKDLLLIEKEKLETELKDENITAEAKLEIRKRLMENSIALKQYEEDKLAKVAADKASKEKAQRIQREKDLFTALDNEAQQHYDNRLKQIDNNIAASQKEQDTLKILAMQGVDNAKESLAAEQKAQAEMEEKRAETLRKKQRAEFALTVFKLETANLEANPENPGKATLDTIAQAAALVSLIEGLPSFFVGTEDTGNGGGLDGKGGFLAINHPHERIVPAEENILFGGVSNKEAAKVMSLYNSNQLAPVAYSHDSRDIVRELKNVRETIKTEKSNTFFDYDRITDSFIRVTESKTKLTIDRTKNGGIW